MRFRLTNATLYKIIAQLKKTNRETSALTKNNYYPSSGLQHFDSDELGFECSAILEFSDDLLITGL